MFNTAPLIEASPWSIRWIRIWDLKYLGERQRKHPHSVDHITVDRRLANWALLTLWCMMSISKKW